MSALREALSGPYKPVTLGDLAVWEYVLATWRDEARQRRVVCHPSGGRTYVGDLSAGGRLLIARDARGVIRSAEER